MESKKIIISTEEIREFTKNACLDNGLTEEFFQDFWQRLCEKEEIYKEYVYYLVKRDFKNQVQIEGYHVIDVLIWQMDHFKAKMDMDNYAVKHNEALMIISAFDTFLKMADNPEEYTHRMQVDTGTEYPDKFYGLHK